MIHTAQISYSRLSTDEFKYILALPRELTGLKQLENDWRTEIFWEQGINWIYFTLTKKPYGKKPYVEWTVTAKINLKRLAEPGNEIDIFNPYTDFLAAVQNFNTIMNSLCLPEMKAWKAKRVDYSVNVVTPHVKLYIDGLMKNGKQPYGMLPPYVKEKKRRCQRKGSVYFVSAISDRKIHKRNQFNSMEGTKTYNFYDKEDQLNNIKDESKEKYGTFTDPELGHNIMRLEIECNRQELYYFKRHKKELDIPYNSIIFFIEPTRATKICHTMFKKALKDICGTGEYCSKSMAVDRIKKSNRKPDTKVDLLWIIKAVAGSKVENVRERVKQSDYIDIDKFDSRLKILDAINVNAVTIPDKYRYKYGITGKGLDNPYTLFLKVMQEMESKADPEYMEQVEALINETMPF